MGNVEVEVEPSQESSTVVPSDIVSVCTTEMSQWYVSDSLCKTFNGFHLDGSECTGDGTH